MRNGRLSTNLKKSAMYDFLSAYLKINRNTIKRHFSGLDVLDPEVTIAYIGEHIVPKIELIVNGKVVKLEFINDSFAGLLETTI